ASAVLPKKAAVPTTKPVASAVPKVRQCLVAYWYDPMVPDKHFDQPGKSPFMDMQLVPKFAPGADQDCTIKDVPSAGQQP
ncbi:MAG: efflux transporter periplasmic adaptor subunit, partial [Proteobacteria bacterium]|nr:efflux transporter periplasmic adaptor subunit [Pseudomonadota bacterium]